MIIGSMSCGGGHLGFPIGIKNRHLVKDIPMIIPLHFGFSQFISFREEDLPGERYRLLRASGLVHLDQRFR
jgi:hypothetical protein